MCIIQRCISLKKEKAWKGVVFPNILRLRDSTVCVWNCSEHFLANQERRRPRIETRFSAYRISTMSSGDAAVNPNRSGLKRIKQTNKKHRLLRWYSCVPILHVSSYFIHLSSSCKRVTTTPSPFFFLFFFTAYDVHAVTPPLRVGELLRNPPSSPFEETPDSNVSLSLPVSSHLGGHE